MSSEDADDEGDVHIAFQLPLETAVLLLIIPVFILEHRNRNRREDRSQNTKRTGSLIAGVLVLNFLFQTAAWIKWMFCWYCPAEVAIHWLLRWYMKGIVWIFLIHRAKMAQGMEPILSAKWFEKIFPRIVSVILFFMTITSIPILGHEFQCTPYIGSDAFHYCANEFKDAGRSIIGVLIGIDTIVTIVLLTLFSVPLYRVYTADIGVLNDNQLRQRLKLKNLLIWAVSMTLINQLTSIFTFLPAFDQSAVSISLWFIGRFDPAINVWSAWLMITRNRQYLRKLCRCRCISNSEALRRLYSASGFTNVLSKMDSQSTFQLKSRSEQNSKSRGLELSENTISAAPEPRSVS